MPNHWIGLEKNIFSLVANKTTRAVYHTIGVPLKFTMEKAIRTFAVLFAKKAISASKIRTISPDIIASLSIRIQWLFTN